MELRSKDDLIDAVALIDLKIEKTQMVVVKLRDALEENLEVLGELEREREEHIAELKDHRLRERPEFAAVLEANPVDPEAIHRGREYGLF